MELPEKTDENGAAEYLRVAPELVRQYLTDGLLSGLSGMEIKRLVKNNLSGLDSLNGSLAALNATLPIENVLILNSANKSQVLEALMSLVVRSGKVTDAEKFKRGIYHREELMSTGIGYGVAIPHVRCNAVQDIVLAACVVKNGVPDYESLDDVPIKLAFMIAAREDQHATHLKLLSQISRALKVQEYLAALLQAQEGWSFHALLTGKME